MFEEERSFSSHFGRNSFGLRNSEHRCGDLCEKKVYVREPVIISSKESKYDVTEIVRCEFSTKCSMQSLIA